VIHKTGLRPAGLARPENKRKVAKGLNSAWEKGMAVQFILGRSGTGKTKHCIKAIVDALLKGGKQSLILLVPEQATYQAEQAIFADSRISGYSNRIPFFDGRDSSRKPSLNVLSFARLQFLLLGKNTALPELSRIGTQMMIHKLLLDNRQRLQVFGPVTTSQGLSREMAETIAELHQYAKTAQQVHLLAEQLSREQPNSISALKFADIALIFEQYLASIEGRFIDPYVQLNLCCRAVAEAKVLEGVQLWVDGFASFTKAELEILVQLLKKASFAQIALCLDPSKLNLENPEPAGPDRTGPFGPTEKTYAELLELIRKNQLKLLKPIILDKPMRFSGCPPLAHVEKHLFETEPPKTTASQNIRIVSARNARSEVHFVAKQIHKLVREKGYRYRDIAVISSELDRYQHYIRAYFEDYNIPFFIDRRKTLNQHPVVELICSALQVVTDGFPTNEVFTYLKTDLVPLERRDVDLLENYCIAFGVEGTNWLDEDQWQFADERVRGFDQQQIDQLRRKAIKPLVELKTKLVDDQGQPKELTSAQFAQIIFDFLDGLGVRQRLGQWIEEALEAGDQIAADEHRQFYDKLVGLFDELTEVFDERKLTYEDYLALLTSAFSQLTLAFIPPSIDQVLVGSIERSRHPELRAVFLIGATQSRFPTPVNVTGILSDEDRAAAESLDFGLAASSKQKLIERQYLAYIAFTRPSELLYVTYPLMDEKANPEIRSQFLDELESLFHDFREESAADEWAGLEDIHNETELADLLCSALGRDRAALPAEISTDQLQGLLDELNQDDGLVKLGRDVSYAIGYQNRARLDEAVVGELFRGPLRVSATRLGTFAACPYRYFARYVLELEPRAEFKFEPPDLGTFYHRVLDVLVKKLKASGKDIGALGEEELSALLNEQIAELTQTDAFIANFMRRSKHNNFIITSAALVLEGCVRDIARMIQTGKFRPVLSEVTFGDNQNRQTNLGDYTITLAAGREVNLGGKIDRLDVASIEGKQVALVIDYKRSAKSFSWSAFYHGLDMQLPIYMLAVRNSMNSAYKNCELAGAFYLPIEAKPAKTEFDKLDKKAATFAHKAKGLFNGRYLSYLDSHFVSGWNRFYSFYITKSGDFGQYNKNAALKPQDFEKVLRFTERKIVELAEQILSGRIEVRPYKRGTSSPCSNCEYKAVCRFDWQINDYNFLEGINKTGVLERIGRANG